MDAQGDEMRHRSQAGHVQKVAYHFGFGSRLSFLAITDIKSNLNILEFKIS